MGTFILGLGSALSFLLKNLFFRKKERSKVYRKAELSLGSLQLRSCPTLLAGVRQTHRRTKTKSPSPLSLLSLALLATCHTPISPTTPMSEKLL